MSCDWDVCCVDCNVESGISDANHQMELMRDLIANRSALEALAELNGPSVYDVELKISFSYIPLKFWSEHKGHKLRPISEYGQHDLPCGKKLFCRLCEKEISCSELEHPRNPKQHGHSLEVSPYHHWMEEDQP